jgi:hypothetical protein
MRVMICRLIKEMAAANRLWGAKHLRDELLKVGINVAKTTVQRYMRQARPRRGSGQTWATFPRTHAAHIWACGHRPPLPPDLRLLCDCNSVRPKPKAL